MKKIMLLAAFVVLGATMLTAQERDQDRIQDQDRTKLVMVNGEMLELQDRAQLRLKEKQTLADGTIVHPDGTYQIRNGERLRLQEGECLDGDGIKYRNEYQYRYKVNQENKGLVQNQIEERNQNRLHYMLVDGEMYRIENQFQNRLQSQFNLADGGTVNPDGTYQTRERKQLKLQDGECLNLDGQKFQNLHQHRKMMVQKNIQANKKMMKKTGVKKPVIAKKKGKKSTR
ncbi:MAG: hypothetical protein HKP49_09770 [Maribacter sp.]|nr:hypothetical protein [Maribacter sp.]